MSKIGKVTTGRTKVHDDKRNWKQWQIFQWDKHEGQQTHT